MFKLSKRSLKKLKGVKQKLVSVTKRAIQITSIDFGVTCGLRTIAEQRKLVKAGASQTMKSKHLDGRAVDVLAYIGRTHRWELKLYYDIAEAMRKAAIEKNVKVRWGGAWHVPDIRKYKGSMEQANRDYVALRRKQKHRIFIDGPHFELMA